MQNNRCHSLFDSFVGTSEQPERKFDVDLACSPLIEPLLKLGWQSKRGSALATTELLAGRRSGGRHIFRVELGDPAAPHADERL